MLQDQALQVEVLRAGKCDSRLIDDEIICSEGEAFCGSGEVYRGA